MEPQHRCGVLGAPRARNWRLQKNERVNDASRPSQVEAAHVDDSHWIVYQTVAARRLQWDNLVWQAPALSLTAQAFLLTITLSADYEIWPRRMAAGLALAICLMSLNLLSRHRLSEVTDAQFLAAFEDRNAPWIADFESGEGVHKIPTRAIHGERFRDRREAVRKQGKDGRVMTWAAKWPSSKVWFWGLALFGVVALVVEVGSFLHWTAVFPPPRP